MKDKHLTLEELTRGIEESRGTPREYELQLRRATKLRQLDRNSEAVSDYFDVATYSSEKRLFCHAKAMLSLIAIESREYKEALWWGASAFDSDPSNLDANMAIGLALIANDFHRMAIPFFESLIEKDEESSTAQLHLGICLRETLDFQGAHQVLNQLAEQTRDPRAYYELGWNWHVRHDVPESKTYARSSYLKALDMEPSQHLKERIIRKLESLDSMK